MVSPRTHLPVRPRLSTILCKFSHKKYFSSGVTPLEGVTLGGPTPVPPSAYSDATVCLFTPHWSPFKINLHQTSHTGWHCSNPRRID